MEEEASRKMPRDTQTLSWRPERTNPRSKTSWKRSFWVVPRHRNPKGRKSRRDPSQGGATNTAQGAPRRKDLHCSGKASRDSNLHQIQSWWRSLTLWRSLTPIRSPRSAWNVGRTSGRAPA